MAYYAMATSTGGTVVVQVVGDIMVSFMTDPANPDYAAYQEWVAEGNTPEPWPPAQ